jgi:hypothetical protein
MAEHTISGVINVGGNVAEKPEAPPDNIRVHNEAAQEHKDKFIAKIVPYANETGVQIQEREVVLGTPPADYPRFVGIAGIRINLPNGQAIDEPLNVPIFGAATLAEAFALLPGLMEAASKKRARQVQEHIMGPKIAIPGQHMPMPPMKRIKQ